ncbi:hypothetical protein ABFS83_02G133700 [Erythranthe nasuta]
MDSVHSGITYDDSRIRKIEEEKSGTVIDEQSIELQKLNWFAMEKRIMVLVEKLNLSNILSVAEEISKEDLIAGRGLFCQAVMKSQLKYPESSNIYAALVAVINSEFPDCGLLLVKRVVLRFKLAHDSGDKKLIEASLKFVAHLVNQRVVYELLACDVLLLLLGNPSSDNVELAVGFCTRCGWLLQNYAPHKLRQIFGEFLRVLREGEVGKRVQVMILKLFSVKKSRFRNYPSVVDELDDIVDVDEQVTHDVSLLMHEIYPENSVDEFNPNLEFDYGHEIRSGRTVRIWCEDVEDGDEVSSDDVAKFEDKIG